MMEVVFVLMKYRVCFKRIKVPIRVNKGVKFDDLIRGSRAFLIVV